MKGPGSRVQSLLYPGLLIGGGLLAGTGLYGAAFPGLRAPYLLVVLLHAGIGVLLTPIFFAYLWFHLRAAIPRQETQRSVAAGRLTAVLILLCAAFGISLLFTGATRPHAPELWIHQISGWGLLAGFVAHLMLLPQEKRRASLRSVPLKWAIRSAIALFAVIGVIDLAVSFRSRSVAHADAATAADFSPSLAATASGGLIPAEAFLDTEACEQCHADIYTQWHASAHHFASFNNPFYRRSVEYAAERIGYAPTKFCGACHDPLLLFSGQMDGPINASSPEAQAGITCQVCHGIIEIRDVRGNGSYTIAPPGQYPFAKSHRSTLQKAHNLLIRLKPGPHREAMLKPFHTTPEFCSVCHKVHIPEAVNNFKWTRGQDEYDHWHNSGVSGFAVASWTPPNPSPKACRDCHMPPLASSDFGAKKRQTEGVGGKGQGSGVKGQEEAKSYTVRSHRFLAANTALPAINGDDDQLRATIEFLQDKKVSVDIVALVSSPLPPDPGPSSFSFGPCYLPLTPCFVHPGETIDLHIMVSNVGVGHTFPGGTIDSNEVWLEVVARDGHGRIFYRHGGVGKNGDVDPAAHFYKAVLLDRSAQLINKRNVHDWVATLYARTIPPGASDVARYRMTLPQDVGNQVTIDVKLHYRKFNHWFTNWVFAGQRVPGQKPVRVDQYVDESLWTFTDAPVPELPIVTIAESRVTLPACAGDRPCSSWGQTLATHRPRPGRSPAQGPVPASPSPLPAEIIQRLNSYGIGLLLQQDTNGAWAVFETVIAQDPQFLEGYINLARTQLATGSLDEADATLHRALGLDPAYPKALYVLGRTNRARGDNEQALELFRRVVEPYPKDRRLRNEIAQLLFLEGRYEEAITELENVLTIDPENLAAHYTLMLSYQAVGEEEKAQEARARYLRYKPDEAITHIAGRYRLNHPEAGLETQPTHVHE